MTNYKNTMLALVFGCLINGANTAEDCICCPKKETEGLNMDKTADIKQDDCNAKPLDHVICTSKKPTMTDSLLCESEGLHGRGLKFYKKWWEKTVCDIYAGGEIIVGTPIFMDKNTLRIVNDSYSYFIPLEKIDFIRTKNGLRFEK